MFFIYLHVDIMTGQQSLYTALLIKITFLIYYLLKHVKLKATRQPFIRCKSDFIRILTA